jgi:hypothetical protein
LLLNYSMHFLNRRLPFPNYCIRAMQYLRKGANFNQVENGLFQITVQHCTLSMGNLDILKVKYHEMVCQPSPLMYSIV